MPANKITDFKEDEAVWVKLGSHPWWPARVAGDQEGQLYKNKKVHVVFFGDDTEAWVEVKKMKTPFAKFLPDHGKAKRVTAAVQQAQVWLSESAAGAPGGDDMDAESSPDDDDGTTAPTSAAAATSTGDDAQASSVKTEAHSENTQTVGPTASAEGAKQVEDGGEENTVSGAKEPKKADEQQNDEDEDDDNDDDDDDSELSLSDDDSDDDGPAFEPEGRKSAKPAAKRKASARGAPSAKRSRSDRGAVRGAPKEKARDDPVPANELRDAPVSELVSLRGKADEGMSSFAEASKVVDSLSTTRAKLQAKLDKVKKQEKQAIKLQQDAKAKIRSALKEVAGCKMPVSALQETKWGKTVRKLSKFEGDANISRIAEAQLNRWKANVSVETDASAVPEQPTQKQSQSTDQDHPSPKPPVPTAEDVQAEVSQVTESTDSQGDKQSTASTAVAPPKETQAPSAPPADAVAESADSEKIRAKARGLLATVLGLSPDCDPAVAATAKETAIAKELEAESFRIHGQPQNMSYKMRFRTLKLALKENESLRQALLSGETSAAAVARDEKLL